MRLKVRITKELQCKIKTCFNKKSCRWRVDTQVWNERGRSCFTVKYCELWVLEAEVLKCSIELMRTNTHGLNLTILQQCTHILHYALTSNEQVSSYAFTHNFIWFRKLKHPLFFLLSQGLISAFIRTRKINVFYDNTMNFPSNLEIKWKLKQIDDSYHYIKYESLQFLTNFDN